MMILSQYHIFELDTINIYSVGSAWVGKYRSPYRPPVQPPPPPPPHAYNIALPQLQVQVTVSLIRLFLLYFSRLQRGRQSRSNQPSFPCPRPPLPPHPPPSRSTTPVPLLPPPWSLRLSCRRRRRTPITCTTISRRRRRHSWPPPPARFPVRLACGTPLCRCRIPRRCFLWWAAAAAA